mmetsp:Transcript_11912/g.29956  ORF Transcript_11912/g.29956 Transcript_11912/m.29956 type:complete len:281 (+) Transcript_11912:770-1612(+)
MKRIGVRDGVGRRAHIRFDGMRQRIHAGRRCQALGHPYHEQRVIHCQRGCEAPIYEGHLDVALIVGDDAEARHLRCRARRGVHCHHRQHGLGALVHALVVLDAAAVGGQHADGLGAVVGGATAEGDDEVAAVVLEQLAAGIDLLNRGVGSAAVVDGIGHPSAVQHICESFHSADLHEDCVGDDERLLLAEGLHLVDRTHQGSLAEQRLAGHVEGAALLTGRWVVVVHTMGALRCVASEVLLDFPGQLAAGNRFVDWLQVRSACHDSCKMRKGAERTAAGG